MDTNIPREAAIKSLQKFITRRDELLHEDIKGFGHYLERFVSFCNLDPLVQSVFKPLQAVDSVSVEQWWEEATQHQGKLSFPDDEDEELVLRFRILESVAQDETGRRNITAFGFAFGFRKLDEMTENFRSLIVRPFVEEISRRLGEAANMATPEAREMQAVPLNRIPASTEIRIFLSHKTADKPLVRRYFAALKQAGFSPWMDEADMPVGTNLERALLNGFKESCAAVFFITENFKDENFLATEVDYARMQLRKKDKKFAIITLRYSSAASIPELLEPYVYASITNDLEGFVEILRALPLETGPVRWKAEVI